jgi:putative Mg2+ transporter-C (MgtC) family protein
LSPVVSPDFLSSALSHTTDLDLDALWRMGAAVSCGSAVGFNRFRNGRDHPHRLRVHVLVGLSACLLVLAAGDGLDSRSRVIQGVATGVGFLGAGEILQEPRSRKRGEPAHVRGLTSAASIWFTAALGVTVATSSPSIVLIALVLALIVLSFGGQNNTR